MGLCFGGGLVVMCVAVSGFGIRIVGAGVVSRGCGGEVGVSDGLEVL